MHARLKRELQREGLSQAEAARRAGLSDSQGLRDVLAGKKRLSAELLGALAYAGIDALFVLVGRRSVAPVGMTEEEIEDLHRLVNLFRSASNETRAAIGTMLSALHAQDVQNGKSRLVRKPPQPSEVKTSGGAPLVSIAGNNSGVVQSTTETITNAAPLIVRKGRSK